METWISIVYHLTSFHFLHTNHVETGEWYVIVCVYDRRISAASTSTNNRKEEKNEISDSPSWCDFVLALDELISIFVRSM